jgi:hypothetical protein
VVFEGIGQGVGVFPEGRKGLKKQELVGNIWGVRRILMLGLTDGVCGDLAGAKKAFDKFWFWW